MAAKSTGDKIAGVTTVMTIFPGKSTRAIGTFIVLACALPWAPLPRRFAGMDGRGFLAAFALPIPKKSLPTVKVAAPPKLAPVKPPPPNLTIPPGSLDTFFAALHAKRTVRVLHYGDSPTTADSITADVRRILQTRFGDAGHGFLLIAKPWAWYGHNGVKLDATGWKIEPASQARAPDGFHGLGGVSFRGETDAVSHVTLPDEHHTGAVVYYLAQPEGGTFTVTAGEATLAEVDTAAEEKKPGFAEFPLPEGTRTIELHVTRGKVRLFGYRFDKQRPGIEYSSLGINGAQVQMIVRSFDTGQWTAALRHENPDLVVLNYGTNESIYPAYIEKQYPDDLRTVIARIRAALPRASLMLMSPMDRGVMEEGEIVTPPELKTLIGVQQKIAAETGCAFFNTYVAMGGAGTMGRWYRGQPRLVSADFIHPMPQGAAKVGALFAGALIQAYEDTGDEARSARPDPHGQAGTPAPHAEGAAK